MRKFLTLRIPILLAIFVIVLTLGLVSMRVGALITDYWDIGPWRVDSSGHLLPGVTDVYNIGSDSLKVADLTMSGDLAVGDDATVSGKLTVAEGFIENYELITTTVAFTLTAEQAGYVAINSSYKDLTVTLPNAETNKGIMYYIKAVDTGTLTIDGGVAGVIDGAATYTGMDAANDCIGVKAGGLVGGATNWWIFLRYIQ